MEQKVHDVGVVLTPDMANVYVTMRDAAAQARGAANAREEVDLNNKTDRSKILKAAAGVAVVTMRFCSKLV